MSIILLEGHRAVDRGASGGTLTLVNRILDADMMPVETLRD